MRQKNIPTSIFHHVIQSEYSYQGLSRWTQLRFHAPGDLGILNGTTQNTAISQSHLRTLNVDASLQLT